MVIRKTRWLLTTAVVVLLIVINTFRLFVTTRFNTPQVESRGSTDTLVVAMHGRSGTPSLKGLKDIIRGIYPDADIIAPSYPTDPFSNVDPYVLADTVETEIYTADQQRNYQRIVLIGHSLGAILLRKLLVWAHGFEEDRPSKRGERAWPGKIERFVSLAGINRGWSIDPAPEKMQWPTYLAIYVGEKIARLTRTGTLGLSFQRGAPFVADLRIQWIRAARQRARDVAGKLPPVIHLVGSIDDIVSGEDSRDIAAAKEVKFVTIPNVGHSEIAEALREGADANTPLRRRVHEALTLPPEQITADTDSPLVENRKVTRIVYIMHGIRDYASWSDQIRAELKAHPVDGERDNLAVVPAKYGYFPMIPFLLAWDRQRNVRWFMDEFTDNLAKFPQATDFDYVGHSNGTYILASALQRYHTLRVRNVLFVGSVVPKHYPWGLLLDEGRVAQVENVVATSDWVVAFFPRLFEQMAEWQRRKPATGFLDIGSAGFRGFEASQRADGRVENITYVAGGHSAGIDFGDDAKLRAIVGYLRTGDANALQVLRNARVQSSMVSMLSNVSWLVWLLLASIVIAVGCFLGWLGGTRTVSVGPLALRLSIMLVSAYVFLIVMLLYSV
jgi:pimeloyl-ACP methyl ester carboxylesterase